MVQQDNLWPALQSLEPKAYVLQTQDADIKIKTAISVTTFPDNKNNVAHAGIWGLIDHKLSLFITGHFRIESYDTNFQQKSKDNRWLGWVNPLFLMLTEIIFIDAQGFIKRYMFQKDFLLGINLATSSSNECVHKDQYFLGSLRAMFNSCFSWNPGVQVLLV